MLFYHLEKMTEQVGEKLTTMKNKNDSLENFIKNKFNELDGSSDGWDVPDASVFDQVVNRIPSNTVAFYQMPLFKMAVSELPGYDISKMGQVRHLHV